MESKLIRADQKTWQKLKTIAEERDMYIRNVLAEIMAGRLDPTTL
jgi:predicted DNA-binding ribbon-helix-helix protein